MPIKKEQHRKQTTASQGRSQKATTVRQPGLCQVRTKVTHTVAEPVVVTIECIGRRTASTRLGSE